MSKRKVRIVNGKIVGWTDCGGPVSPKCACKKCIDGTKANKEAMETHAEGQLDAAVTATMMNPRNAKFIAHKVVEGKQGTDAVSTRPIGRFGEEADPMRPDSLPGEKDSTSTQDAASSTPLTLSADATVSSASINSSTAIPPSLQETKSRVVQWKWHSLDYSFGILYIRTGGSTSTENNYFVERLSKEWYRFTKLVSGQTVTYSLRLSGVYCGCDAFTYSPVGAKTCKHLEALAALKEAGKL